MRVTAEVRGRMERKVERRRRILVRGGSGSVVGMAQTATRASRKASREGLEQ